MQSKRIIWSGLGFTSILLLMGVTMAASGGFSGSNERTDCPGKVTCPINGEEVCKNQCPLIDASRTDCPGKVECLLTGELVCRDQCPLGASTDTAGSENELPPCCRSKK
tara:strand:- start:54354 stop:54680 length:327 start_codon:yes stop_codon:yes gene_type:complete